MKVREIMTIEVATASPDSTLEEVASMMKEEDAGAIPVLDDDQLVGIVTDRDIVLRCIAEGKDPTETNVEDILTDNPVTIEPDADVEEAARLMSERQIRRLPVVEDGELLGVISLGDIAVKESDEETAGEALEGVSQGVKRGQGSRQASGERNQNARAGKKTQVAARAEQEEVEEEATEYAGSGREDREARIVGQQSGQSRSGRATSNARGRASSGGQQGRTQFGSGQQQSRKSPQPERSGRAQAGGISNRNLAQENSRQQKVTSGRREARTSGRRKTG